MTLNQLECFMVLSQRLNYTQAAEDLFMAQPALSRVIASLEKELDVQLFYRNSRSVSLTAAGTAFLRECPRILDSYRRSVSAAQLAQKGYRGEVVLGVLRDAFDAGVVDIYRAMGRAYPEVRVAVRGYSHSELVRLFAGRELDAIVNFGSEAMPEGSESVVLRRDRHCVAVPVDSPLARARSLRMEDLKDEKFVAMTRTASRPGHDFLFRMAAEAGFIPNVVAEADHVPAMLMLVACGIGVTTLTEDLEYLSKGRVAFIPLVGVPLSSHALVYFRESNNPSLPLLLEVVRGLAAPGK